MNFKYTTEHALKKESKVCTIMKEEGTCIFERHLESQKNTYIQTFLSNSAMHVYDSSLSMVTISGDVTFPVLVLPKIGLGLAVLVLSLSPQESSLLLLRQTCIKEFSFK